MHQLTHLPRQSRGVAVRRAASLAAPLSAVILALLLALLTLATPGVAAAVQSDSGTSAAGAVVAGEAGRPRPSPVLTPERVIGIQLDALQHNDTPSHDAGIATTFAFASPANRVATGPFDRFASLVKAPAYRPMLNFVRAERGPMRIDGDEARQRVTIFPAAGGRVTYIFRLTRQQGGEYDGCWMTDGVTRVNDAAPLPHGMRAA